MDISVSAACEGVGDGGTNTDEVELSVAVGIERFRRGSRDLSWKFGTIGAVVMVGSGCVHAGSRVRGTYDAERQGCVGGAGAWSASLVGRLFGRSLAGSVGADTPTLLRAIDKSKGAVGADIRRATPCVVPVAL